MNEINPQTTDINKISSVEPGAKQKKASQTVDGTFDKILTDQIEKSNTADARLNKTAALPEIEGTFNPPRLKPLFNPTQFAQKLTSSLDMFETYVSWLGSPDKTLRQAYELLEAVSAGTETLEQEFKADQGSNTDLKDLLTRLRTTLAVEHIKFNRGDYSA